MLPMEVFSLMKVLFITVGLQRCLHHRTNLKQKIQMTLRTTSGHLGEQAYLVRHFLALHAVPEMTFRESEEFLSAT